MSTKKDKIELSLRKRQKGMIAHTTIPPVSSHTAFAFDDGGRHRKGAISGDVWISNALLSEKGTPVSIVIEWEKQ